MNTSNLKASSVQEVEARVAEVKYPSVQVPAYRKVKILKYWANISSTVRVSTIMHDMTVIYFDIPIEPSQKFVMWLLILIFSIEWHDMDCCIPWPWHSFSRSNIFSLSICLYKNAKRHRMFPAYLPRLTRLSQWSCSCWYSYKTVWSHCSSFNRCACQLSAL